MTTRHPTRPGSPIRVALVDDHTLFRETLKVVLNTERDIQVIGDAANLTDGLAMVRRSQPDVLIQDICLGADDGLQMLQEIRTTVPAVRCLILTGFVADDYIRRALRKHADGFLLKSCSMPALITAIRQVAGGHKTWDNSILTRLAVLDSTELPERGGIALLTPPEHKIARLIAEGLTNREIGVRLHLAEKTIRNRVSLILDKLHVTRRAKLAALYTRDAMLSR